jgi:Leucine-rich repeat (LRR) protein
LYGIPAKRNDPLQELISAACSSASEVVLDFRCSDPQLVPSSRPFPQLEDCLLKNSSLTSLHLLFEEDPLHVFNIDQLIQSLTGLQDLDLRAEMDPLPDNLDIPSGIVSLCCLTELALGPGYHLRELPQILPHMTRLQSLCLQADEIEKPACMALSTLTSLQTLELRFDQDSVVLPSMATLNMLQTLDLSRCHILQQLPALDALSSLQTLKLGGCEDVTQLPPLHNLTALRNLEGQPRDFLRWPGFDTLKNLQSLVLEGYGLQSRLPRFADFTSLQSLEIRCHARLQKLPSKVASKVAWVP